MSKNIVIGDTTYNGVSTIKAQNAEGAGMASFVDLSDLEQTKTVALSMSSGDQTISPDSNKVLTQVTVQKPSTLIAENIKKDIVIGGITGSYEGVGVTAYDITTNLTNCTASGNNKIIINQTDVPVYIQAVNGYAPSLYGSGISVSGASYTYEGVNSVIKLSNPTSNVTINATCSVQSSTINLSITFTGDYYNESFQVRDGKNNTAPLLLNLTLKNATLTQSVVCSSGYLYFYGGAGEHENYFILDQINSGLGIIVPLQEQTGNYFESIYRIYGGSTFQAVCNYDF